MLMPLTLLILSANATPPSLTRTIDTRPDGKGRITRALPACQWAEKDLVESIPPSFENTATGTVLRLNPVLRHKLMGPNERTRWERTEQLTGYAENKILERYAELGRRHGRRNYFYETEDNLREISMNGVGFSLKSGALIVSTGDASLMRYLFAAPAFEFQVLEANEIDGEIVYRPTGRRGTLPMDVITRSAEIVFGGCEDTLSGHRVRKRRGQ